MSSRALRLLALILLALSSDAHAQQWRIVDNVRQRITLQSLDTQSLQVYNLAGNLIATHAVIAPLLAPVIFNPLLPV